MKYRSKVNIIIGHRGTGKSTWMNHLHSFYKKKNEEQVQCIDLDKEIEKEIKKTSNGNIESLFEKGELFFRKLENEVAKKCFKQAEDYKGVTYISVGAGFSDEIPSYFNVIHLQRMSDCSGRIFFNRPKLLPNKSDFEEFIEFYEKRVSLYKKQRDEVFTRLDYYSSLNEWDFIFLGNSLPFRTGVLTLDSKFLFHHQKKMNVDKLKMYLRKRKAWGLKYFELKEDHWGLERWSNENRQIALESILSEIPLDQILWSIRLENQSFFPSFIKDILKLKQENIHWDIPYEFMRKNEWKRKKNITPQIISFHDRDLSSSFEYELDNFSKMQQSYPDSHLKLAVEISSFEELFKGYQWWKKAPDQRSFHPRSQNGKWKWYRLLWGVHQKLYFIKEDLQGEVKDQPCLAESVCFKKGVEGQGFVAVLGNPIDLSKTPFEGRNFFSTYKMPVVGIPLKEEEMNLNNLHILKSLGLKFSAVTSPLKIQAYNLSKNNVKVKSVNTLSFLGSFIEGFNTDFIAIEELKASIKNDAKIAVWGGGGVRNPLQSVFKKAIFFSARTRKCLTIKDEDFQPEVLIWAVGRVRMKDCQYPLESWTPRIIYDLNYTEDSPGREYAKKVKAIYVSGKDWFQIQAKEQREIFKQQFLKNE